METDLNTLWTRHRQFVTYLIGGAYNTLFGFVFFAVVHHYFSPTIHYTILAALSNIAAITNAFVVYRLFVFKSKGNMLKEYLRFYVVYGVNFLVSLTIMVALVELLGMHPVVTQGIILIFTVLISYFGHRHYSFQKEEKSPQNSP
ncbi:MAG: GtrA family protein [Magnetococcales bacterium]|nr:GtrA family protein [Magnetococcales bacterium]